MKIKNIYLIIILKSILLNTTFTSQSTSQATTKNHQQMPMISENELKEIMQNAVEEYKRLPEAEKELMSQQIGIKREELDEIMNEASNFVEEINTKNNKKSTFDQKEENTFNNNSNERLPQAQIKSTSLKNETKEQITIFEKAIKTLQTLNLKASDQLIREKIISEFDIALSSIEKIVYYLLLIKQFLINNENQIIIPNADINKLLSIAHKINNLKESIEKLITLNEYETTNNKNNLFAKYNIKKPSNTELKIYLENEITLLKKKIEELEKEITENDSSKKEKTKKIINLEYKIDILETDLTELETNILENKKQNNQFNEYQKLLNESLDKIIKNLKNIFITDNAISEIEEIIRKYFPEEYKIGKEKEEHLQKQINTEKKIKEQKGAPGDILTERDIKMSSIELSQKDNSQENTNNFQSQNNNTDENEYDNYEESESPFDFPKEENQASTKNDKEKTDSSENKDSKETKNHESHNDKKKYRDLRHKETKEKQTKEKKENNEENNQKIEIISNKLKEINQLINNYTYNNPESLYSQINNETFIKDMENKLQEIKTSFSTITKESIKTIGKSNPFFIKNTAIKEKGDTTSPEITPLTIGPKNQAHINTELEKIDLLKLKLSKEPLPEAQLIVYQFEEILELLNISFNNKTRPKDYALLKNSLSLLEEIFNEYKKTCIKLYNSDNIPYWLLNKNTIAEKIALKDEIELKKQLNQKNTPSIKAN